jgi:chromosome segregation ATPase
MNFENKIKELEAEVQELRELNAGHEQFANEVEKDLDERDRLQDTVKQLERELQESRAKEVDLRQKAGAERRTREDAQEAHQQQEAELRTEIANVKKQLETAQSEAERLKAELSNAANEVAKAQAAAAAAEAGARKHEHVANFTDSEAAAAAAAENKEKGQTGSGASGSRAHETGQSHSQNDDPLANTTGTVSSGKGQQMIRGDDVDDHSPATRGQCCGGPTGAGTDDACIIS